MLGSCEWKATIFFFFFFGYLRSYNSEKYVLFNIIIDPSAAVLRASVGRLGRSGVVGRDWVHDLVLGPVDAQVQPREQAVLELIADELILQVGVAAGLEIALQVLVLGVGRDGLLVGVVRGQLLDAVDEVLFKVHLADVRGALVDDGVVGQRGGVRVRQDVDVQGAALVVAGEDGLKVHRAVRVRLLDAAQPGQTPGLLPGVVPVLEALLDDATVDASGIGLCMTRKKKG